MVTKMFYFSLRFKFVTLLCLSCTVTSLHKIADVTSTQLRSTQYLRRELEYAKIETNCSIVGPSLHTGKPVISGKVYFYHIFIGRTVDYSESSNKVNLLKQFITDLSGSMLSKIMLGYADSFGNISSTNYAFGGNYFNTTSLTSINDAYVYDVVQNARQTNAGWSTPVSNSLYLVVFNGNLKYNSDAAGSFWNTANGWCGFHSNNLKPPATAAEKYIIMPVGGKLSHCFICC